MNCCRLSSLMLMVTALSLLGACASQPGLTSGEIDELAAAAMQEFNVPGAVIGVVKDGKIVHAAGYGVRELGQPGSVDSQTLFRIASLTKAMTTAALAMLVDEGKLAWDDKVVDHIPGFQMYDPWVTKAFTVTDLVTHRSGLKAFVGDLMLWPRPNSFTREDIIHGLRYFKPVGDFRTQYDYDNLLYIVAGELIPAAIGDGWEEFVDQRILRELDTDRCFAGRIPEQAMQNLAVPHATVDGALQVIDRNRIRAEASVDASAGGVRCSLDDMLKWIQVQLAHGALADGSQLFSREQSAIMWSPKTILGVSKERYERDGTHFRAYGLGWRLADVHGYKHVSHTGSFTGSNNSLVLIPELNLGVVVMLNASAGAARQAIMKSIVDPYLGVDVDWVLYFSRDDEPAIAAAAEDVPEAIDFRNGTAQAPLVSYTGVYRDPWFGDVLVELQGDELWFVSVKSPRMKGRLWPLADHTFYVYWSDRTLEADAYVTFDIDETGQSQHMDVLQVSDDADWDFAELDLARVLDE